MQRAARSIVPTDNREGFVNDGTDNSTVSNADSAAAVNAAPAAASQPAEPVRRRRGGRRVVRTGAAGASLELQVQERAPLFEAPALPDAGTAADSKSADSSDSDESSDSQDSAERPTRRRTRRAVSTVVDSDSEDKSLSWEDRKKHTIEYLRDRASLEELLLACADKLANMRSIKADYMVLGDKVWDRFHRGKEQQSWYYSSLIDVFDGLSDYEMYWEISNLYTDVFVSYYLGGELGDRIYQSSGIETYCYTEEECRWTPVSTRAWKKLEPKLKVISKKEAIALEDAWRDQYPSLMCLVRHRHDTDVIVDCAKRLLDEGKDPSWFEGMWDNMGGGIPADTLRALECAFVALYTRNRGLSR